MKTSAKIEPLDFWTWMGTLPNSLETAIIIIALIVIVGIIIGTGALIYFIVKNRDIKSKYIEITKQVEETKKIEEKKLEEAENDEEFHQRCPRKNDIMILLTKSFEVSNYEISIMKLETMREQMDYADNKVSHLMTKMESLFITKLKTIPEVLETGDVTKTNDYVSYRAILTLLKNKLMDIFRGFCRENHFAELSEAEFDNYSSIKARTLLNEGTKFLNDIYFPNLRISRDELYSINSPGVENFMNIAKEIMKNARKVAIKNNESLIEKKMELAGILESFVGSNNVMLDTWKKQHKLI